MLHCLRAVILQERGAAAAKVHGISAADLEGKPAFGAAFAAFLDALDGARAGAGAGAGKRTLLVAHNGSNFDFRVLARVLFLCHLCESRIDCFYFGQMMIVLCRP